MNVTEEVGKINEINEIISLAKKLKLSIPVGIKDYTKKKFMRVSNREVWWNNEGNVEDLIDGDGETYSCGSYHSSEEDDNYFIVEVAGCEYSGYFLFKKSNEVFDN